MEPFVKEGLKICTNGHGPLIKMAAMPIYEGESISNQTIPFPMDRDGHDCHGLFQYMFYTWIKIAHVSSHSLIRH